MKGMIFDIKKFAIHDGPGIRTTVFFKGCPMECWWCHNPEALESDASPLAAKSRRVAVPVIMQEIEKDRIFYDESGGGVTFSGGEPLAQPEFLAELLSACRQSGIHTAVDTCGHAPSEDFERIIELTDLFLYDIKLMDTSEHKKYTGVANDLVLDNLKMLLKKGSNVQLRIPMIPGITDTERNLEAIAGFLSEFPGVGVISLLPYNRFGEDKRKRFKIPDRLGSLPTQERSQLEAVAARFSALGHEVKIGG